MTAVHPEPAKEIAVNVRHDCRECEKRCGFDARKAAALDQATTLESLIVYTRSPVRRGLDVEPWTCPHGQAFWVVADAVTGSNVEEITQ